jgi:UDP-3-O-[3-hydroxymyristoyl] glucosamine N-acyltransferase
MNAYDQNVIEPDRLLSPGEVAEMLEGFPRPREIIGPEHEACIAQTGFCFSPVPHVLALAMDRKWLEMGLSSAYVGALVIGPELADAARGQASKPVLIYDDPAECFYLLHNRAIHERTHELSLRRPRGRIADSAVIHRSAIIEDNVAIGEGVQIGAFSVIKRYTIIGEGTKIAEHCTIGAEGLFFKEIDGQYQNLNHFGGVRIGRNCVIHPATVIAGAVNFNTWTTIADDVAIGNRTTVGHDVSIGPRTTVSVNAMIAGRARIGAGCWLGACTAISNSIEVGDGAKVRIGAVVVNPVPSGAEVSGNFAVAHHKNLRRMLS